MSEKEKQKYDECFLDSVVSFCLSQRCKKLQLLLRIPAGVCSHTLSHSVFGAVLPSAFTPPGYIQNTQTLNKSLYIQHMMHLFVRDRGRWLMSADVSVCLRTTLRPQRFFLEVSESV